MLAAEYDIVIPAVPRGALITILSVLVLLAVAVILWLLNRRPR